MRHPIGPWAVVLLLGGLLTASNVAKGQVAGPVETGSTGPIGSIGSLGDMGRNPVPPRNVQLDTYRIQVKVDQPIAISGGRGGFNLSNGGGNIPVSPSSDNPGGSYDSLRSATAPSAVSGGGSGCGDGASSEKDCEEDERHGSERQEDCSSQLVLEGRGTLSERYEARSKCPDSSKETGEERSEPSSFEATPSAETEHPVEAQQNDTPSHHDKEESGSSFFGGLLMLLAVKYGIPFTFKVYTALRS